MELAKCLKLVAPITMTADAQMVWLQAACDALEGIRSDEVQAVSAELRRKVTRHSQIVPTIAELVAQKRARASQMSQPQSPYFAELEIGRRAQEMRASAKGDKSKLSDAFEWERQARIDAGLHVEPYPKPLSQSEIEALPGNIRSIGLKMGFLRRDGERLVEA